MEAAFFLHPALEEIAEWGIALCDAVLESEDRIIAEELCGDLGDPLLGESLGSGVPGSEGNNFGICCEFKYLTDSGSVELAYFI